MRPSFVVLCFFAVSQLPALSAETPAPTYLSPQWKNRTYHGLMQELRPMVPENMKFMFLGDPIPCSLNQGRKKGTLHGYGGFVAMRKKSYLWRTVNILYFYLIDSNGSLCALKYVNDLHEDSLSPQMVDVDITETQVWVPPTYPETTTISYPDADGKTITMEIPTGVMTGGYYDTVVTKVVTPRLDSFQQQRRQTFERTKVRDLPACQ